TQTRAYPQRGGCRCVGCHSGRSHHCSGTRSCPWCSHTPVGSRHCCPHTRQHLSRDRLTHTHTHTQIHTHSHTYTQTYTDTHIHTDTHTHTQTYTDTHVHTHTHTHTHTQTHTHCYTNTPRTRDARVREET